MVSSPPHRISTLFHHQVSSPLSAHLDLLESNFFQTSSSKTNPCYVLISALMHIVGWEALYRQVWVFPYYVHWAEFTTGGLQSWCLHNLDNQELNLKCQSFHFLVSVKTKSSQFSRVTMSMKCRLMKGKWINVFNKQLLCYKIKNTVGLNT